jgi:oligogalacturonide lyase
MTLVVDPPRRPVASRDPVTGRGIIQLTFGDCDCVRPYVYKPAFSADGRYIVYSRRDAPEGRLLPCRLDVETGETVVLSTAPHYEYLSLTVDPTGREAVFDEGDVLRAVDLHTLESRVILRLPDALSRPDNMRYWLCGIEGRSQLLMIHRRDDGRTVISTAPLDGSSVLTERHVVPEGVAFTTHVQFNPADPNLISYNRHPDLQNDPTQSPEKRARAHLIDLRKGSDEPFLIMPPGWRATHEHWSPDGKRLFFHRKHCHNWVPASIASIDVTGGDYIEHFRTDSIWLGHSTVNPQQTHVVSDSQFARKNELVLIDLRTGGHEILCYPNASGRGHPYHVHPSFSPDGQFVLYTSDVSGVAHLYLVPVNES